MPPKRYLTAAENFALASAGRAADECWPWTGKSNSKGYGMVRVTRDGRSLLTTASRVTLQRTLGRELSPVEFALHKCDNPPCVNPAHIYAGDVQRNSDDMVSRGRSSKTFTDEQVLEIIALWRAGGISQSEIGRRYGMSSGRVSCLVKSDWQPGQARPWAKETWRKANELKRGKAA